MDDLITKRQAVERMNDLMVIELKMTRPPSWNEVYNAIKEIPSVDAVEVVRCKDCIYFELDHWVNVNGQPLIVAHEICAAWGGGCKTKPDGYCNMGERKEDGGICL